MGLEKIKKQNLQEKFEIMKPETDVTVEKLKQDSVLKRLRDAIVSRATIRRR